MGRRRACVILKMEAGRKSVIGRGDRAIKKTGARGLREGSGGANKISTGTRGGKQCWKGRGRLPCKLWNVWRGICLAEGLGERRKGGGQMGGKPAVWGGVHPRYFRAMGRLRVQGFG